MTSLALSSAAEIAASLGATPPPILPEIEEEIQVKSNHYSPGVTSSIEEKALSLLGSGIAAESVASALGVTPARVAQLLANEKFAGQVAALRYETLQVHNKRDAQYDSIEDTLLDKLESSMPFMHKPTDILRAIQTINGAKRRGQSSPEQVTNQQNIVNLVLPTIIAQKFSVNINNQVTRAGDQELHTMPSSNLLKKVEDIREAADAEHTVDATTNTDTLLIEQESEQEPEPCIPQEPELEPESEDTP